MKKFHWVGLVIVLALGGCISRVEREAISFPSMPGEPVYHRIDGAQLPPDQAIDVLQHAENACLAVPASGGAPQIGSPAFDACMKTQGYRRAR